MRDLRTFLAGLDGAPAPPRWPPGELRAAWDACDDVETMIAVLRRGGAMGVFEVDSTREFAKDGLVVRWLFRLRSAGRYYRIDVARDAGADEVRRCFSDFPDDWTALLDARRDAMPPLERLRSDLSNGRPPRIDEATQRAWAASDEPTTMIMLLQQLGYADAVARLALPPVPRGGFTVPPSWRREAADVVRAAFPRLPPPA